MTGGLRRMIICGREWKVLTIHVLWGIGYRLKLSGKQSVGVGVVIIVLERMVLH
jgi:hypothetical protein